MSAARDTYPPGLTRMLAVGASAAGRGSSSATPPPPEEKTVAKVTSTSSIAKMATPGIYVPAPSAPPAVASSSSSSLGPRPAAIAWTTPAARNVLVAGLKHWRRAEKQSMDGTSRILNRDLLPIKKIWGWTTIPASYFEEETPIEPDWARAFAAGSGSNIDALSDMDAVLLRQEALPTDTQLNSYGLERYPSKYAGSLDAPLIKVSRDGLFTKLYNVQVGRIFHPILLKIHAKYLQIAAMGLCPIRAKLNSKNEYVVPGLQGSGKIWNKGRKALLESVFQGCNIVQTASSVSKNSYQQLIDAGFSSKEALAVLLLFNSSSVCADFGYNRPADGSYDDAVARILGSTDATVRQSFQKITTTFYSLANL